VLRKKKKKKPGAIAAELGNGDPNHLREDEIVERGAEQLSMRRAAASNVGRSGSCEGRESLGVHARTHLSLQGMVGTVRYLADVAGSFVHRVTAINIHHRLLCTLSIVRVSQTEQASTHPVLSLSTLGLFMLPAARMACGCWLARHHPSETGSTFPTILPYTCSAVGSRGACAGGYLDTWVPWPRTWSGGLPGCWVGRLAGWP
jgi:hypothetical protein